MTARLEHGVAQEGQPLVGLRPPLRPRRVRDRLPGEVVRQPLEQVVELAQRSGPRRVVGQDEVHGLARPCGCARPPRRTSSRRRSPRAPARACRGPASRPTGPRGSAWTPVIRAGSSSSSSARCSRIRLEDFVARHDSSGTLAAASDALRSAPAAGEPRVRAPGDVLAHAARGDLDRPLRSRARRTSRAGRPPACAGPSSTAPPCSSGASSSRSPRSAGRSSSPPSFERRDDIAAPRTAPSSAADEPSMTFSATLPVKPSATITSAAPVPIAKPSTLPTKFRPCGAGQRAVRGDDDLGALGRLGAVGEQRHARRGDAADGLHERRAHVRELDQVLGPDLDVRARVEQQERRARAPGR